MEPPVAVVIKWEEEAGHLAQAPGPRGEWNRELWDGEAWGVQDPDEAQRQGAGRHDERVEHGEAGGGATCHLHPARGTNHFIPLFEPCIDPALIPMHMFFTVCGQ